MDMFADDGIIDRVWVKASIDGTDYLFDPALKSYTYTDKIDLAQATGYVRSDLLTEASIGATEGSDFIQNLNQTNINNKLVEYSNNLANTIRTQHPNSEVKEIIGGREIIPEILDQFQTTLPWPTTDVEAWDDIPEAYTATFRVEHVGIDHTFDTTEIGAKRLTVTYAGGDYHPELRLDGELIASGNATTPGTKYDLTLTIDHPYAAINVDQRVTHKAISDSTYAYAIVSDFGGTSNALIDQRRRKLNENIHAGLADTSEAVLGETLNVMGLTWMRETFLADRLVSELAETVSFRHHFVGVMAQETGYYIDVKAAFN
ncbi:MAG: hypothetical protein GY869_19855, partial [Planctomycetes bacterium]|nr:hypothetical protein [Planctomycetota bacterium]